VLDRDHTFGGWRQPPAQVDLSSIHHEAKLRVQFRIPLGAADRELCCRLVSGGLIVGGKPTRQSGTYEVFLSRWRDELGSRAKGRVQARCRDGWVDLAVLVGTEEPARVGGKAQLDVLNRIDYALLEMDWHAAMELAEEAMGIASSGDIVPAHSELLHIKAARAWLLAGDAARARQAISPMRQRHDIPEALLVVAQLTLRSHGLATSAVVELEEAVRRWPESSEKGLALAECWYRLTRSPASGSAALQTARERLLELNALDAVDRVQAGLLRGIVALVQGRDVPASPSPASPLGELLASIGSGLSTCDAYLRTPLPRWTPPPRVPALLDGPLSCLYDPDDRKCIQACILQLQKEVKEAGRLLQQLPEGLNIHWLGLLLARQAILEGHRGEAIERYRRIVGTYQVVLDEIP